MKFCFFIVTLLLQSFSVSSLPTWTETRSPSPVLFGRANQGNTDGNSAKTSTNSGSTTKNAKAGTGSNTNTNAASTTNNKAGGAGQKSASAVSDAADAFASDVAIVSSSLNGMGQTTNQKQIASLAKKGFVAETDEDSHRAVLNAASAGGAKGANQKIVDNTPIVLNGLQSIMNNPSMANTMKNLQKIESARNANILPSITQLSNSAFQQTGVNQQAQQFKATTGTKSLQQLQAATPATTSDNASDDTNDKTSTTSNSKSNTNSSTTKSSSKSNSNAKTNANDNSDEDNDN